MNETRQIEFGLLPPYKYFLKKDAWFNTGCCPKETIRGELCTLHTNGWLHIEAGYPWDGATWAPDSDDMMRPSLGHDALLRLRQQGHAVPDDWQPRATSLLNRLCREDGSSKVKRFLTRNGVRRFGKADPKELERYRKTFVAPRLAPA